MVQAQLTADSWYQAQADAHQAAPNELLASPYRSLWDACLSVTPVAKLLRSHRYKYKMHPCPPPLWGGVDHSRTEIPALLLHGIGCAVAVLSTV